MLWSQKNFSFKMGVAHSFASGSVCVVTYGLHL
jgi:hypothetical protein